MTKDEMARVASEYAAAKDRHDAAAALAGCTDDYFLEVVPFGEKIEGKHNVRLYLESFFRAFPDYVAEIESKAFGDDLAVAVWIFRGTLLGEFLGAPPTGRSIALPAVSVYLFREGRLRGERVFLDVATLCEQAGIPIGKIRPAADASPGNGSPRRTPASRSTTGPTTPRSSRPSASRS